MGEPILSAVGEGDRFVLRRRLGAGSFGIVYEAHDRRWNAMVALKLLHQRSPSASYHFKQEFRLLAGVVHPNLCTLYELHADREPWFFTMELVRGAHFLEYLQGAPHGATGATEEVTFSEEHGTTEESAGASASRERASARPARGPGEAGVLPPEAQLREALLQLARAVHALHEGGVLHRDLKPSNVRVTPEGRVVVLDFGLVEDLSVELTARLPRTPIGTPRYMAPELWAGAPASEASDWYSVGVILYQALAGRLPPPRHKTTEAPAPPSALRPGVPADLDALCLELLHADREARPRGSSVVERLGGAARRAAPAWGALPVRRTAGFVGRERETAALKDAFDAAARGSTVVVHVRGPSGMGKTALLQSFLDARRGGEALVLTGRCYEHESVPYKAFDGVVDDLGHRLSALAAEAARALLPADVHDLLRLFPVLRLAVRGAAARSDEVDPQEARRRAFRALKDLLSRLAAERPLIVWVDDVQWGDVDGARLLAEILSPPAAPPLLFLLSYRSDEADHSAFLAELSRLLHAEQAAIGTHIVEVGPLSEAEALEVARARLDAAPRETCEAIARASGGNPFFIEEAALDHEAPRAPAPPREGAPSLSVDDVIRARLARLEPPARALLDLAAVAGGPLDQAIAREAAGDGAVLSALSVLRAGRLIRSRQIHDQPGIEPFHDRIREAALAALGPEARAACHRRLAEVFARAPAPDPEVLAMHYGGAGEHHLAAQHAEAAGDRASDALAFDRAADLYGRAIAWRVGGPADTPERRRSLLVRRGHALAYAGRGAEAAPLYLEAAGGEPRDALDLRRRAAEQLLASGHIDQGVQVLAPVLGAVGLAYPSTATAAAARSAGLFARLLVRGQRFRERREDDIPPAVLARVDVCGGAGRALTDVDTLRATYFQLRHLILALDAGEPARIAEGLGTFGAMLTAQGTPATVKKGRALVDRSEAIARRLSVPRLVASASIQVAFCHLVEGAFRDALGRFDEASRLLVERCRGVALENNLGRMGALMALYSLGDLPALALRSAVWHREATEVGDRFGRITAALNLAMARMAADDVEESRRLPQEDMIAWSQRGFHVQHLYALRLEVYRELYEARPHAAHARITDAWREIEAAQLHRVQFVRIDVLLLRARTAIASAAARWADRGPLLALAERDAARLEREVRRDMGAAASLIRAGAAAVRGDIERARAHLAAAEAGYEAAGMALLAACAHRRGGEIEGGAGGRRRIEEAEATMKKSGVLRPDRWARAYAPGFER